MNKVRKVTVDYGRQNAMLYTVGNEHPIVVDKTPVRLVIASIEETEMTLLIYLKHSDDSVQLWKKIPKNEFTTVEYFID